MRIFYISHLFLPRYAGGTEILTYQVARQMQRWGHDVTVLACENFRSGSAAVRYQSDQYNELKVLRFFLDSRYVDNPMRAEYFREPVEEVLVGLYARERPDLIHAHHFAYLTTAVATAAFRQGIPVVCTCTDFWLVCPTYQLLRYDLSLCNGPTNLAKCAKCIATRYGGARRYAPLLHSIPETLLHASLGVFAAAFQPWSSHARLSAALVGRAAWNRRVAAQMARILVPSRFLQQTITDNGFSTDRQTLLPFGLDTGWRKTLTPRHFAEPLRIGFIGTIAPHKGLHLLLEAFAGLQTKKQVSLEIFGGLQADVDYARHIRQLTQGLENVHFRGTFPPAQLGQILNQLDLLAIPSLWYENTPLVLYAAQAAQLPVVGSDVGGLAEVIEEGRTGWLFPRGDVERLREKLHLAIHNPERLSDLSLQIPPVKTMEAYAAELLQIYEECLGATDVSSSGNGHRLP